MTREDFNRHIAYLRRQWPLPFLLRAASELARSGGAGLRLNSARARSATARPNWRTFSTTAALLLSARRVLGSLS